MSDMSNVDNLGKSGSSGEINISNYTLKPSNDGELRQPEIALVLQEQDKLLHELMALLDTLNDRLSPVLNSTGVIKADSESEKVKHDTSLANQIASHSYRITVAIRVVAETTRRLEI
jgi:hypothetical protein